jgi:hypothetical protein
MPLNPTDLFVISDKEGRWPNRTYFSVLPGTPLHQEGTKEEYIDWLYDAVQSDENVAAQVSAIVEAIESGQSLVRIIVPDRFNDYRGNAVIELVKQVIQ